VNDSEKVPWRRTDGWVYRHVREHGESAELRRMAGRWHTRASRTDRNFTYALELEEVLHATTLDELRMLTVRWHALADLSDGNHACADELDDWVAGRAHSDAWDSTPRQGRQRIR